jgi:hypothetical protein
MMRSRLRITKSSDEQNFDRIVPSDLMRALQRVKYQLRQSLFTPPLILALRVLTAPQP